MSLIKEKDRNEIRKVLSSLTNPVQLIMFTQDIECQSCTLAHKLSEEMASLSDLISFQVIDFDGDAQAAEKNGVEKIPAIVVRGEVDYGVRIYGIPGGYQLSSFIETIVAVSRRESGLEPEAIELLNKLKQPVHIQVMVSSTCPKCVSAALMAHQISIACEQVTSDSITITEFPQLVTRYGISNVPVTIINERKRITGGLPVIKMIREILRSTSNRREIWPRGMWQ